jgi:hypothetical protein
LRDDPCVDVPRPAREYLEALVDRLGSVLGKRLLGAYAVGSVALGAYRHGSSDLDVCGVVSTPLDAAQKRDIAVGCSHAALACPARKLELVLFSESVAAQPGPRPRWELNLNTGSALAADHVGVDPAAEPSHWFVLDLALAHRHGLPLLGPDASRLIGAPRDEDVRRAQLDAARWYAAHGTPADTLVAACRAWHWRVTGGFAGKRDAVRWAGAHWVSRRSAAG